MSALLAEATTNDRELFLEAATESFEFISNQLYNSEHIVQDGISASKNDSCALNGEKVQEPYNSGLTLEGLAILYSITQNASIYDMCAEAGPILRPF